MNRAVQGDIVVVKLFDEREWKAPTDEVVDQDCKLESIFSRTTLTVCNLHSRMTMRKSLTRKVNG